MGIMTTFDVRDDSAQSMKCQLILYHNLQTTLEFISPLAIRYILL